jgi:TRAP-type C4-dicarboxylate transport system permease large subunit
MVVLFTVVAGCFVDATVLIIMLTPIFLPLVKSLHGDPVHFGIVFIIAATIGNFTPPIGAAMYTVCSILRVRIGAYTVESLPLLAAVVLVTLLLIFIPGVVLLLPTLLFR